MTSHCLFELTKCAYKVDLCPFLFFSEMIKLLLEEATFVADATHSP